MFTHAWYLKITITCFWFLQMFTAKSLPWVLEETWNFEIYWNYWDFGGGIVAFLVVCRIVVVCYAQLWIHYCPHLMIKHGLKRYVWVWRWQGGEMWWLGCHVNLISFGIHLGNGTAHLWEGYQDVALGLYPCAYLFSLWCYSPALLSGHMNQTVLLCHILLPWVPMLEPVNHMVNPLKPWAVLNLSSLICGCSYCVSASGKSTNNAVDLSLFLNPLVLSFFLSMPWSQGLALVLFPLTISLIPMWSILSCGFKFHQCGNDFQLAVMSTELSPDSSPSVWALLSHRCVCSGPHWSLCSGWSLCLWRKM